MVPIRKQVIVAATVWLAAASSQAATAVVIDPIMWNRLGSQYEVEHSDLGPNGTIVGTQHAFEPAQFDNGYVRKATGDNYVKFPASIQDGLRYRGAIELWIKPKAPNPVPYQYGIWAMVGSPADEYWHALRGNVYLFWGDGITGRGFFGGIQFDGAHVRTPDEPSQFVATPGVPVHAAICWDINGIAGTGDTVRVYRNGAVVGATTGAWNPAGTVLQDRFWLGTAADGQGYDKWISDNIKVWDYAKTNYSDRFIEPEPSTALALLTIAGLFGRRAWRWSAVSQ